MVMVVFAGEVFSYCKFQILFDNGCIMFVHPSTDMSRGLTNVMLSTFCTFYCIDTIVAMTSRIDTGPP